MDSTLSQERMVSGETMADCIRQLLELGPHEQRETLVSLSRYAATKNQVATHDSFLVAAQGLPPDASQVQGMQWLTRLLESREQAVSQNCSGFRRVQSSGPQPALQPGPVSRQRIAVREVAAAPVWASHAALPADQQSALVQQLLAGFHVGESLAPENLELSTQQVGALRTPSASDSSAGSQMGGPLVSSGVVAPWAESGGLEEVALAAQWQQSVSQLNSPPETKETSLRSYLNHLKHLDSGCILLARKINRLGFESAEILKAHYSTYGEVAQVFVPHSRSVARSQSHRPFVRRRPSGIGFIVMNDSEAVNAILLDGEEQAVAGVMVQLQRFQPQRVH